MSSPLTQNAHTASLLAVAASKHTPMAFVQAILKAYEKYGKDPCKALAQARIAPEATSKLDARISALQLESLSYWAMQELDDEALGWFSRRLPWGSYGMLCRASLGAPNLEVALKRWCRHHRLLTEDMALSLETEGQKACLTLREDRLMDPAMREFGLLTSLRYVLGYACWAIDSRIALESVSFPFDAPPHAGLYARLFGAPVTFDVRAATARFCFDRRYLALPLCRNEEALAAMLKRALLLTVLQYRKDRLIVERVSQKLREQLGGPCRAQDIAARLNMSVRTLHRQLEEEEAHFQALKDKVRMEVATALLLTTAKSIKQIAMSVGFDHEKSFIRAFRAWAGKPPLRFREEQQGVVLKTR
jgi:AraC-like DNA-binding protein